MTVLDELTPHYAEILADLPDEFDSHRFILALARAYQPEFVRALHRYVDVQDRAVFRTLDGLIGKSLHDYADYLGDHDSPNIFGIKSKNARWRKRR